MAGPHTNRNQRDGVTDLLMAATRMTPVNPGQTMRPVRVRSRRRRARRTARALARPIVRLATWLAS
jgi:hypothetical protein